MLTMHNNGEIALPEIILITFVKSFAKNHTFNVSCIIKIYLSYVGHATLLKHAYLVIFNFPNINKNN
jgi:hypothetical protein